MTSENKQKDSAKLKNMSIQLLPKNFTHNYEFTSEAMKVAKSRSRIRSRQLKDLLMNPLFREFFDKFTHLARTDSDLKVLNSFEHDKSTLRKNTNIIFYKIWKSFDYDHERYRQTPLYFVPTLGIMSLIDAGAATKVGVHFGLYTKTLLSLGTDKHQKWVERAFKLQDFGCFMLTEMGHGSNVQGITTLAVFDAETGQFVINSPINSAMKFWIGNLAETANMGVIFANLIVNGQNQGPHGFLVRIRDDNGNVLAGMTIGDCGYKMGINSVDNGWVLFDSLRLPRDALLDRFSQVSAEGHFTSKIKSTSQRFAVQIGALSGGRIGIGSAANIISLIGSTIAVRYTNVRKQFGETKGMENVVIDYPLVHSKLVSRVSNALVYMHAADVIDHEYLGINVFNLKDIRTKELHALSSYIKVAASWNLEQNLSKCRELCGGHGYSAYSNLGMLINDSNVHVTWEGTNEVLLQQTCKNLMAEFKLFHTKGTIRYKTLEFLADFKSGSVDVDGAAEKVTAFAEEATTGDLASLIKAKGNNLASFTALENEQLISELRDLLKALQTLMRARVFQTVPVVLSKFQQYFTSVKETQNNFARTFGRTLPHVLFPAASFFGEGFCFDMYLKNLASIFEPVDKRETFLFEHRPFYGDINSDGYLPEVVFMMKALVLFACNTLYNSASFMTGLGDNIDYEFFNALSDIILKVSESMRFDVLTLGEMIQSPIADRSSIGAPDGDIYGNITNSIFSRSYNFGANPSWGMIKKFREENAKK